MIDTHRVAYHLYRQEREEPLPDGVQKKHYTRLAGTIAQKAVAARRVKDAWMYEEKELLAVGVLAGMTPPDELILISY